MNSNKSILPHQPSHFFTLLLVAIILLLLALIAAKELNEKPKPISPANPDVLTVENEQRVE